MAESMKGLHRTCRCAEVTKANDRQRSNPYGLGSESRNKGGIIFVDLQRQFRYYADYF